MVLISGQWTDDGWNGYPPALGPSHPSFFFHLSTSRQPGDDDGPYIPRRLPVEAAVLQLHISRGEGAGVVYVRFPPPLVSPQTRWAGEAGHVDTQVRGDRYDASRQDDISGPGQERRVSSSTCLPACPPRSWAGHPGSRMSRGRRGGPSGAHDDPSCKTAIQPARRHVSLASRPPLRTGGSLFDVRGGGLPHDAAYTSDVGFGVFPAVIM